ncbi:hypothetical protein KIH77_01210 [Bifidobacterium sp. 82T24]|uniref:hypothetical protein n=1 Tax=Bifidobacterium pluvialisilvae TaxID=2834436 RepID=UPI001C570592|nr:hypothetical protein [Bifidobacterium pluvialisilvae]MBW3087365.1 hypothetical protein [Bifidobacterium pluvialisilvae]
MTGNKDSNANPPSSNDGANDDERRQWEEFISSHENDLDEVARSRSARKFDKAARKAEKKKAQFNVQDLKAEAFAQAPPAGRGPRDFRNSSWLDVDEMMDGDSTFTPPNPSLGPISGSGLLFVILLVAGVLGLVAAVLLPSMASLLGTVCGVMTLIGAGGLFARHRGHTETRRDVFDDGARV